MFEIDVYLRFLQRFQSRPRYGAMFQALCFRNVCINLCDTPLHSALNGQIGGKITARRGTICTRRARPTAIAVPLVRLAE